MKKSLQVVKKRILKKEEILRDIHYLYPHLSSFSIEEVFTYFKTTKLETLNEHIKRIKLQKKHHLDEINTKSCFCVDSKGYLKDLYASEVLALEQKERLYKEKNILLNVYLCPNRCGWHLSRV